MNPSTKTIERILGCDDSSGQLKYLIKFKSMEECDLVEAEKAYSMWPQFFLKYFEQRLTWHNDGSSARRPQNFIKTDMINKYVDDSKKVEQIIGGTISSGQLLFLVKWQGVRESEFIVAKEAYLRCPKLMLKWYHDKINMN